MGPIIMRKRNMVRTGYIARFFRKKGGRILRARQRFDV
jgi:hypothetical protein